MSVTTPPSDPRFPSRGYKKPHTDREAIPIPDPVADFTISPAAPTTADSVTLTSTSTPVEYIEAYEWTQIMPPGATVEGPPVMNLGAQVAGAYVWNLRVRLEDGRWSTLRSRGVNITATEDPEEPEPPDPEEPEPPPDE